MFGTSGIRGIVGKEINPGMALKVGEACGTLYKKVVVGYDPRTSSIMIRNAVIAGFLACGADVVDAGMVSTPTLAYAARKFDVGIMVTASHNPAEYNGIKIFNKDGSGLSLKETGKIEKMIMEEKEYAGWDKIKGLRHENFIQEHMDAVLNDVGEAGEREIVIDCSNGAASTITPHLLRKMGCKVVTLNSQPDGFFPAHNPEPVEENMQQLKNLCHDKNSFGIAHDCDGDRMVIVNKNGRYMENEKLIILFAKYVDAKKIVVPVDTSMILDDYINGEIVKTRVGDIFISEKLKEINGDFGAEASGTWIFPSFSYCPDGIFAAGMFVKMLEEMDVSKEIEKMPYYPLKRDGIMVNKKKIQDTMEKIGEEIEKFDFMNSISVDGFRIEFEDAWALIRASGTEPKIRITVEARDTNRMEELRGEMIELVKRCAK